jgi:hypothetical protein
VEASAGLRADGVDAAVTVFEQGAGNIGGGVLEHGEGKNAGCMGLEAGEELCNPVFGPCLENVLSEEKDFLSPDFDAEVAAE